MTVTRPEHRAAVEVIGCSSISFRHRPLSQALDAIVGCGFLEIDLGALPGVCDHIPMPLDENTANTSIAATESHGLIVRSINADPGALNDPSLSQTAILSAIRPVIELAQRLGAAVVVPCGRQSASAFVTESADLDRIAENVTAIAELCAQHDVRLWVEALHSGRFCNSSGRAGALLERLSPEIVGLVFDVSHIVAVGEDPVEWLSEVGDRVEHVHLRDAELGNISISIGRGAVDFAAVIGALEARGYDGHYALELETHDIREGERDAVAADSFAQIIGWFEGARA